MHEGVGERLEQLLGVVKSMVVHFHERVREEAVKALGALLVAAHRVKPPAEGGAEWVGGGEFEGTVATEHEVLLHVDSGLECWLNESSVDYRNGRSSNFCVWGTGAVCPTTVHSG